MAPERAVPIRVLVVEPHPLMRESICASIGAQGDMLALEACGSGEHALERFPQERPDVIITEARLCDLDAGALITRLRDLDPAARVLVFSAFDSPYEVYTSVRSGARGYLSKASSAEDLVGAIREVAGGHISLSPRFAAHVAERASAAELSAREIEVLARMAEGDDNAEIARHLYVTVGTVKYHVANILRKLTARDRLHALALAYRWGLLRI